MHGKRNRRGHGAIEFVDMDALKNLPPEERKARILAARQEAEEMADLADSLAINLAERRDAKLMSLGLNPVLAPLSAMQRM